jgi:hypothetical protein
MNWFARKFSFADLALAAYPGVLERLRGTPARLTDRVCRLPRPVLIRRDGQDWSIQEHAGHLLDLGALDRARLEDYAAGRDRLQPADPQNRKTYDAAHNAESIDSILSAFRDERLDLVSRLELLDADFVGRTALHPRLQVQMRVVDWAYFVAEHDDHHLAQIGELIRKFAGPG